MRNVMKPALLLATLLSTSAIFAQDEWDDWEDDPWGEDTSAFSLFGFLEGAAGHRLQSDPALDEDWTLGEARLQLEGEYEGSRATWRFKVDGVGDAALDDYDVDVREAMVNFPVGDHTDVRLGRQILTWGTGDLIFLNDLFPKDWVSFLAGRDQEYLKAPSDAARISWYGDKFNVDAVLTPRFESDRYLTGERLSFFDPARGRLVAAPPRLWGRKPDSDVSNAEVSLRIYGMTGDVEWAIYGHRGFFPQPTAFDPETGDFTFARLNALGASIRGNLAGGLYNVETVWYDSSHNRDGTDPNLPNSEFRFLAGYERELFTNFTLSTQYYLEWLQDHDALQRNWPFDPDLQPDEHRHVVTARLNWRLMRDDLIVGMMNFYSPSDDDYFLRPTVHYRHSDQLAFDAGMNLFGGDDESTFYGQFENNSSLFARMRYSF